MQLQHIQIISIIQTTYKDVMNWHNAQVSLGPFLQSSISIPNLNTAFTPLCFNLELSIITLQTEQQPVKHKQFLWLQWLAWHWHDCHPNIGKHVTVEEVGVLNKLGRVPCALLCLIGPASCQYNSSPCCTIRPLIHSDKLCTASYLSNTWGLYGTSPFLSAHSAL